MDEALEVCRQIAEGIEAAHEKGIIHRDLKPANVKITPEGKVKVLDFGLAKAFHDEPAAADLSHSPTLTDQVTRPGVILGTAAYMSPEQAKGKTVDKRADIWAFGCVLYECLTGKRAFRGDNITEVMARILEAEPDWGQLPANTPAIVRFLLRRCLQKDPGRRLHDIADARLEMLEDLSGPVEAIPVSQRFSLRRLLSIGAAHACDRTSVWRGGYEISQTLNPADGTTRGALHRQAGTGALARWIAIEAPHRIRSTDPDGNGDFQRWPLHRLQCDQGKCRPSRPTAPVLAQDRSIGVHSHCWNGRRHQPLSFAR